MNDHGTVLDPATIRFQRLLPADIETVWAYLTESDKRGQWLASGDMELRGRRRHAAVPAQSALVGGRAHARALPRL